MENIVAEDTPLAAYLEGSGQLDEDYSPTSPAAQECASQSFAPSRGRRPPPSLKLGKRIFHSAPMTRIRSAGALAVTMTLGKEDNDRFLEHYRYILIASQLLNEHIEPSTVPNHLAPIHNTTLPTTSTTAGAAVTGVTAFAFVWVLRWALGTSATPVSIMRVGIWLILSTTVLLFSIAFSRRQWLKYIRQQAIVAGTDFVECIKCLEKSSHSILSLIQEVEVVARGYQISYPMPPISRLEKGGERKCRRLRRHLLNAYEDGINSFAHSIRTLQKFADPDQLERFLEVYDIQEEDLHEAWMLTEASIANEDQGSIKHLRMKQYQTSVLRRLTLCILLSLRATGQSADRVVWRHAVSEMEAISKMAIECSQRLNQLVSDEEQIQPTTPVLKSPRASHSPHQQRLQSQLRRMNTLSGGVKSLQAKLYLLRDDSTQALSTSTTEAEISLISASLKQQYESLGQDLKGLLKAWEDGRLALAKDIDTHGRRVSRSSSIGTAPGTPRASMSPSIGALVSVGEKPDRFTGLAVSLNSDVPLSPPATDHGSSDTDNEEVFEAISAPRVRERSNLTREERIKKVKEERERASSMKESRDAGLNMVRELQNVIKMRPQRSSVTTGLTHDRQSSL